MHHKQNRYPPAPDSYQLDTVCKSYTNKSHSEDSTSESGSDTENAENAEIETDINSSSESDSESDGEDIGSQPRSKLHGGKNKKGNAHR